MKKEDKIEKKMSVLVKVPLQIKYALLLFSKLKNKNKKQIVLVDI